MRYGMMIELEKCIGCMACVSACKEQWDSGPGAARDWVYTYEHGRRGEDLGITFYPGLCMHCEDHPCTRDCPTGATYRNEEGVVVVNPDVCIGCGNCVSTCAYGARSFDPEKKIIEKCNFCAPYVARVETPACVQTCMAQCRHFGDLDDPHGDLVRRIRESGAKPLVTEEVNIGPKVYYSGDRQREHILSRNVVRSPKTSWLTNLWHGYSLPFLRPVVPAAGALVVLGGLVVNLRSRAGHGTALPAETAQAKGGSGSVPAANPETLPRHRAGMRVLHWFNLLSWVLLLTTGLALMSAERFVIVNEAYANWMANLLGGKAGLLRFHVLWGLLWALVILPVFLVYKKGGVEALREVLLTGDDIRWLLRKPWAMLGISGKPLPPQDKYNAGQKLFAIFVLGSTTLIILTGLVMAFHLGSTTLVAASIFAHKILVAMVLIGLSVHFTMAAIMREERPALKSMFSGRVSRSFAESHNAKWLQEIDRKKKAGEETE